MASGNVRYRRHRSGSQAQLIASFLRALAQHIVRGQPVAPSPFAATLVQPCARKMPLTENCDLVLGEVFRQAGQQVGRLSRASAISTHRRPLRMGQRAKVSSLAAFELSLARLSAAWMSRSGTHRTGTNTRQRCQARGQRLVNTGVRVADDQLEFWSALWASRNAASQLFLRLAAHRCRPADFPAAFNRLASSGIEACAGRLGPISPARAARQSWGSGSAAAALALALRKQRRMVRLGLRPATVVVAVAQALQAAYSCWAWARCNSITRSPSCNSSRSP